MLLLYFIDSFILYNFYAYDTYDTLLCFIYLIVSIFITFSIYI